MTGAVTTILRHAARYVPYYTETFNEVGLSLTSVDADDLKRIPILSRAILQERFDQLRATALPRGHKPSLTAKTSGSTGEPVKVLHSDVSWRMFSLLKQREYRWYRFDPSGKLALLRELEELDQLEVGSESDQASADRVHSWPYVGHYFETGPCVGLPYTHGVEDQLAWLETERPRYLTSMPATLEHLALACRDSGLPVQLSGVLAISQQLTTNARGLIERVFGVPIRQNYGLNEVGLVAVRCPEGGRYHVHAEHCHVEIVDDAGEACTPGDVGRLIVTCLTNAAMPLIRYDTGDLAQAVDGPCPCGRTLPTFGDVVGRYRQIVSLPDGTWQQWESIERAVAEMPDDLARPLRQYQLHQSLDGRFRLRLAVRGELDDRCLTRLRDAWSSAATGPTPALDIAVVESIPIEQGRKFESFTSDFYTQGDVE